jgi:hypothetical protein
MLSLQLCGCSIAGPPVVKQRPANLWTSARSALRLKNPGNGLPPIAWRDRVGNSLTGPAGHLEASVRSKEPTPSSNRPQWKRLRLKGLDLFWASSSFGGATISATKETTAETANKTGTNATMDQKKSSLTPTSSAKESTNEIDLVANTKERRTRRVTSHVGQRKSGNFVCVTRERQLGHWSGGSVILITRLSEMPRYKADEATQPARGSVRHLYARDRRHTNGKVDLSNI